MEKQKSLAVNFIMNIILTMSSFIFPLITFPYISRILLPEGTGKVSFVTSVVSYFVMFAQLGIPTYGIRACAKVRDSKEELSQIVHELFLINLVMCTISYILLFAAVIYIPKFRQEKALFAIISLTIIFNVLGMEWLYKALEQYVYITIRSVIFKIVALLAMFALVHTRDDYIIYGAVSILAASASNLFNFINVHKYIKLNPFRKYDLKKHMKAIIVFFAMSCATMIYTNLDIIMLGFMKTDIDVGYYNAAVKIKLVLVSVVTSLGTVLLPRASYYIEYGMKKEFNEITQKAINFVFIVATPLMVYFMIFAKEGVYLLSGTAYSGAILPMVVIMPTLLLIGFTNVMGIQMLVPMSQEKIVLYSEVAGAAVDLVINMILIPSMSSVGAAIGTLIAEIAVWAVQFYVLKDIVGEIYRGLNIVRVVGAIIVGCFAAVWIKKFEIGNFGILFISASIYFGIYYGILMITKEKLTLEITNQLLSIIIRKKKN